MKSALEGIPAPLQKQIIYRMLGMGIFVIITIVLIIKTTPFMTILPGVLVALLCSVSGLILMIQCVSGNYIVLSGKCISVSRTLLKQRVKYITIQTAEHKVRILVNSRLRKCINGAVFQVYLSKRTPVYNIDGIQVIHQYLAIDIEVKEDD